MLNTNQDDLFSLQFSREFDGKNALNPPKELVYNVFIEYNNKIIVANVYNLSFTFTKDLYDTYKKYKNDYKNFVKELRSIAMYSYWSKVEYEISITSPFPYIKKEEIQKIKKKIEEDENVVLLNVNLNCETKTDVYTQLLLNWDIFVAYTWNNRKLISHFKRKYLS